jgi:hypothetical protein
MLMWVGSKGYGDRFGGDHALEDACCRSFVAFFYAADQLYNVTASTGSKAVPYASGKMNPEGGGVVAAVQRAWADQLLAMASQAARKVVGFKDSADAHLLF